MLHVRGVQVKAVTTSMPMMAVVVVVEPEIWLKEVHGDGGAPQDRGLCSRCGPRRRLPSATAVVNSLPVASAPATSAPMRNLVHTAVLSSMVITAPMEFLHRTFGQAEMTALAGRTMVVSCV